MSSKIDAASLWNKNASHWSKGLSSGEDLTREKFGLPAFIEFIGGVDKKKLLDAGCGDGEITRVLGRKGAHATGVDFSQKMIEIARLKESEDPLKIRYHVSSIVNMKGLLKSSSFDAIISYMVLCCCENLSAFFDQAYTLLKPQGDLFIAVPHPCFNNRPVEWIKDASGKASKIACEMYHDEDPYVRSWDFASNLYSNGETPKMKEVRYPWRLTTYINTLREAGFSIEKILEPVPTHAVADEVQRLERWREHAACFLFLHGKKYAIDS